MKFALTTALTLVAFVATPAFAQENGFYGTVGYGNYSADDADLGAIQLRGGYNFTEFLGAEIEGAIGVADESTTIAGVDVNVELENSYGAYAVGRIPFSEKADVFGRVGYVSTEIKASAGGFSASADDDAAALGIGGNYYFAPSQGVRLGYTHMDYDDSIDVIDIAYVLKF
ncbi:MAG: porin family protein [Alphaproteobacteria bacterium]|nr:porin family protein [Alphaproteobacteria bacterium]MBU2084494.1 porin family protein [Alphaproteobacteria bacterium]MBU2142502.1 porin family protein [Alphaproteobacteria bacterium]MBU2197745.1 porin family protein [Alphaproteobacteria bacterium]